MPAYQRPAVDDPAFRDATGAVIAYGDRWDLEGPPSDTYSVTTHPERFRPLHTVADALIAHLTASYDVEVTGAAPSTGPPRAGPEIVRTTTLRPRDPRAATVAVAHTAFPGVVVLAGALLEATHPVCGCDACDETWQTAADDLEWLVATVTAGQFEEWTTHRDGHTWVGHSLRADGRASSGETVADALSADRLRTAQQVLRGPRSRWAVWPARPGR
ncbi:hypothetical protein AD006_19450 [Pseudonocardia sp. EC080610-09]|uniref:DUF6226 family protein n=1 Tax=unclassified Pseudonocardia TaxID=2619320 RepID=UPI0006CB6B26|nr:MULTISPECIES: DUF6226 family protein [unclassified Pseudonocardia]ALE73530.1 hypothetical protein FRP1_11505 [Pseudonocardia sp. EC080625-04]ALL76938.1 hypothetical protein AD006_19450 [Pseudonocardia sp. EC080610-09]ALL83969.1 hypothetical protein AD017_27290 [Pseudonocardia sp. EC080619-01]